MKNTKFISAGAGSGKTHTLMQSIVDMIKAKECSAEQIILTTYTEAAAQELREKVRSALYAEGLYDEAMNVSNAAIGTIHSIAFRIVSRYWYLLGISANVSIMAPEDSGFYITQSLSSLPSEQDLQLFDTILKNLDVKKYNGEKYVTDPGYWRNELSNLISKTIEGCVTEQQLEKAREQSKELLAQTLKWCNFDITAEVVFDIVARLKPIFDCVAQRSTRDKEAKRAALYESIKVFDSYETLPISALLSLVKTYANPPAYVQKNFGGDVLYFQELLDRIPRSIQVRSLIESYIDTIFRLAISWKRTYEEFKQKRCLMDYNDMLQKFDQLLQNAEVEADIRSRYKVALVDEFQDCSPLLVQSFVRLSHLVNRSIWVGDIKQAIYRFRGTNIELIKSIINKVDRGENGNSLDRLKYCWRSNETIVNFVNNLFCEVFKGQIDRKYVELLMPDRPKGSLPPKERDLIHWNFANGKEKALANKIKQLIDSKEYKANEIAVLYFSNESVKACATALRALGVPYNIRLNDGDGLDGTNSSAGDIASFVNAVVALAARGDNELSKATIVNCIEQGYDITKILSDRLRYLDSEDKGKGWLGGVDVVKRLGQLRERIVNQSVSDAVETLATEINLCELIKRIDPQAPAYNYVSALISRAAQYENQCRTMGLSSTLLGFAADLSSKSILGVGDDSGVMVTTYHKSKGLQWPCVILCSLNNKSIKSDRTFYGVQNLNTVDTTELRLVPSALSGICRHMEDSFVNVDFFKDLCKATIDESKRLMYVGMTRPKEQLILATFGATDVDRWLVDIGCEPIIDSQSNAGSIQWGGSQWVHSKVSYEEPEQDCLSTVALTEFKALGRAVESEQYEAKFVSPSQFKAEKSQYSVELCPRFADRITIRSQDNRDSTVGDFIHHAMCLWSGDKTVLESLAAEYGVTVDVDSLAKSISDFWSWMEQQYGKATQTLRELPFCFTNEKGQIVNGEIDLLYRTDRGDVLVDYKTFQGKVSELVDAQSDFNTDKKYGGQISLYDSALAAGGYRVIDRLVCYTSLGVAVRLKR